MRYLASDTAPLYSMVARLNIELFCKKLCKKLAEEMSETKRRILLQPVAEEKAKLSELLPAATACASGARSGLR